MCSSLLKLTLKFDTGDPGSRQSSGSLVGDQACAPCRDFIMTAFNMTEDQAITAITVGIDFSVSQVSQKHPHALTVGQWKDHHLHYVESL